MWLLCDSVTSYAWQIQPYLGKRGAMPERAQGKRVVLDLVSKLSAGHSVTCDNFFTSFELGEALLQRGITLLGTMRRNKPELPPALKQLRMRAIHSSIFAFTKSATAVSYVAKRNKLVILLSTRHRQAAVSEEPPHKPQMILDYNSTKAGVDTMDQLIGSYSCRRRSNRWPKTIFANILDISALNAFVLWGEVQPNYHNGVAYKRRIFLQDLGMAMVSPHLSRRQRLPRDPGSAEVVVALRMAGQTSQPTASRRLGTRQVLGQVAVNTASHLPPATGQPGERKRRQPGRRFCSLCTGEKRGKVDTVCLKCKCTACKQHRVAVFYCKPCSESAQ